MNYKIYFTFVYFVRIQVTMTPNSFQGEKLKMLDLFSGIGGFTLALSPACRTIAFCDIDVNARNVLLDQMGKGALPPDALLFEDVKQLREDLEASPSSSTHRKKLRNVDIICAGFPCQDISVMNLHGKGIDGDRSGLVFEIFRIADVCKPSIILLENSPNLQHKGLERILEILRAKNYAHIAWDIFSAAEVGAPHKRNRLYLMAVRGGPSSRRVLRRLRDALLTKTQQPQRSFWKSHRPPPRVVPKTERTAEDIKIRGYLLGNAIVPQCARHACTELCESIMHFGHGGTHAKDESTSSHSFRSSSSLAKKPCTLFLSVPSEKTVEGYAKGTFDTKIPGWATPQAARQWGWRTSRVGSSRALRYLPNQIVYERTTQEYMRARSKGHPNVDDWAIHAEFIEWLMGFPRGWTRRA